MPLPKPKPGEKAKDFINRCMANPTMVQEFKDPKQRLAACINQSKR